MNWQTLENETELQDLLEKSKIRQQVIYKHSTRCSISSVVKGRLERAVQPADIDFHYLDLIAYRALSNKIANDLQVTHESPQVLLIHNGKCIYHESHSGITMDDIAAESMRA